LRIYRIAVNVNMLNNTRRNWTITARRQKV